MLVKIWPAVFALLAATSTVEALSLEQAVRRAVLTNPAIGEAAANRRATSYELRQNQGALLPQIRVQADIGPERSRQLDLNVASSRSDFNNGQQANVVVRQLIFDGFATTNEIWRSVARVDASSWRVQERSELVALDTVQSYTDILRLRDMIAQADRNIAVHRKLLSDVEARFEGGRAGRGDRDQVQERVFAAEACAGRTRTAARGGHRAVPARGWPGPRAPVLASAGRRACRRAAPRRSIWLSAAIRPSRRPAPTSTPCGRSVRLQTAPISRRWRSKAAPNTARTPVTMSGRYNELSAKLSASWQIYSGGTDTARQFELAERVTEQSLRFDVLRRQANESIDRAWSTRAAFNDRIRALTNQVAAAERVINAIAANMIWASALCWIC